MTLHVLCVDQYVARCTDAKPSLYGCERLHIQSLVDTLDCVLMRLMLTATTVALFKNTFILFNEVVPWMPSSLTVAFFSPALRITWRCLCFSCGYASFSISSFYGKKALQLLCIHTLKLGARERTSAHAFAYDNVILNGFLAFLAVTLISVAQPDEWEGKESQALALSAFGGKNGATKKHPNWYIQATKWQ